jgi:AcrR family transcriptional regulator
VARVVKDPKVRRKEIMEAAGKLFMMKGYDETSVNMIVEEAGVAKGTFYHYFKTKEEILGSILEEYFNQFAEGMNALSINENMNAFEKMQYILRGTLTNNNGPQNLTRHIEDNKNAKLHKMFEEMFYEKFYPIFLRILKQGIAEKKFNVDHPEEITQILLIGIQAYMHMHFPYFKDIDYKAKKIAAIEELFNKVLGMEEVKFKLIQLNNP